MQTEAHRALKRLSDNDLQRLILELGRYALSVSSRLRWRTSDAAELPRGETVDSVVSLALTKVLTGERRWEPQQQPDLKTYLMDVIDSLLSHLATSRDNTMLTAAIPDDDSGRGASTGSPSGGQAWQAWSLDTPEAALLQREEERRQERALQLLLDASRDDPVVTRIVRAMQDGYGKPADLAEVLGLPVTEVYKAMKRLDRKIIRVRHQSFASTVSVAKQKGKGDHAGA